MFLFFSLSLTQSFAAVFMVTTTSDSDCSDNSCDLQAALDAAEVNGELDNEIRIAQGTYNGNFSYQPSAGNNADISILGGWSTDFTTRIVNPSNTILNGNNLGGVLKFNTYPTSTTACNIKVEGITAQHGKTDLGGGIFAYTLPPGTIELSSNILQDNTSSSLGGGCTLLAGNLTGKNGSTIILNGNIIRHNISTGYMNGSHAENGEGGGCALFCTADTRITNNLIYDNRAGTADTYYGLGGGLEIALIAGTVHLVNNTLTANRVFRSTDGTDGSGGGIHLGTDEDAWAGSNVTLSNNIIYGNISDSPQGAGDISNNIFASGDNAGTLAIDHSNYGDISVTGVTPTLSNNLQVNPFFSTKSDTIYYLTSRSQCIDAGTNSALYIPPTDLAGRIRPQDGNNDGTATASMGCYEEVIPANFPWAMFIPKAPAPK